MPRPLRWRLTLRHIPFAMLRPFLLAAAALLAGCSTLGVERATESPYPPDFKTSCSRLDARGDASRALRWYRVSAEQKVAYRQAYQRATQLVVQAAQGRTPGTWAVIADADETLIDNSVFECESQFRHWTTFDDARWTQWVEARLATALPGAVSFSEVVRKLGGKLIVVSNREAPKHLQATRENLAAIGIQFDAVLLSTGAKDRDKTRRFEQVQKRGIPDAKLPPLAVVLFVGDNIKDFPDLTQANSGDPGRFGRDYVLLPNPTYGSWERTRLR